MKEHYLIQKYKGRKIPEYGSLVQVYRNLRNGLMSVRAKVDGRWVVVGHTNYIYLKDVRFVVSAAGREKVRRTGQKNVHAYAVGTFTQSPTSFTDMEEVYYNPYNVETFVVRASQEPIHDSSYALVSISGVFYK